MTPTHRRAAEILREEADVIKRSYAAGGNGEWSLPDEEDIPEGQAHIRHDEMLALAEALETQDAEDLTSTSSETQPDAKATALSDTAMYEIARYVGIPGPAMTRLLGVLKLCADEIVLRARLPSPSDSPAEER